MEFEGNKVQKCPRNRIHKGKERWTNLGLDVVKMKRESIEITRTQQMFHSLTKLKFRSWNNVIWFSNPTELILFAKEVIQKKTKIFDTKPQEQRNWHIPYHVNLTVMQLNVFTDPHLQNKQKNQENRKIKKISKH